MVVAAVVEEEAEVEVVAFLKLQSLNPKLLCLRDLFRAAECCM